MLVITGAEGGVGDCVGGNYASLGCPRYMGARANIIHRGSNAGGGPRYRGCCQAIAQDDGATGRSKVGSSDDERHPRRDAAQLSAAPHGVNAAGVLNGGASDGGRSREHCGSQPERRESRKTKQTNRFHEDPPGSCDRGHWCGETASGRDSRTVAVIDSPQVLRESVTNKSAI
jgi:hypothetical protein